MCDNGAIAGFAHDKVILPLDDILTKIGADKSNIIPASLKWVTYQGKLYGLPFGQDTWGLYYNTDMFTAAGLDPTKPPTTPDELWDYAAKLTKINADGSLAVAGFIPDDPDRNLESTSNLFNCQFYDEANKKITVNSPECVAWFNWYKKWYDTYNKKNAMTNLISTRTGGDAGLFRPASWRWRSTASGRTARPTSRPPHPTSTTTRRRSRRSARTSTAPRSSTATPSSSRPVPRTRRPRPSSACTS